MSVALVYKSVWKLSPSSITVVSRKDTCCVEVSAVNLVGRMEQVDLVQEGHQYSLPCSQMAKISSMYLHHVCGLADVQASRSSSNYATNRLAYSGVILVPMAVKTVIIMSGLIQRTCCVFHTISPVL